MIVNTSNDLTSTAMTLFHTQAAPPLPPGSGDAGPSSRVPPLEALSSSLSDDARQSLFTGVVELANSGASSEEITTFVNGALEASGVDSPSGHSRIGQLVDMLA